MEENLEERMKNPGGKMNFEEAGELDKDYEFKEASGFSAVWKGILKGARRFHGLFGPLEGSLGEFSPLLSEEGDNYPVLHNTSKLFGFGLTGLSYYALYKTGHHWPVYIPLITNGVSFLNGLWRWTVAMTEYEDSGGSLG